MKIFTFIAAAIGLLSCMPQASANPNCMTQWSMSQNRLIWNCNGRRMPYHYRQPHRDQYIYTRPRVQYNLPNTPAYWQQGGGAYYGGGSYQRYGRTVTRSHREHIVRRAAPQGNPRRAEQLAMCEEQAAKRRALGIPSQVTWDSPYTCRATGGFAESGRL